MGNENVTEKQFRNSVFTLQVLPAEFFWSINISGYLGYNIFQAYIDFLMEVLLCVM